MTLEQAAPLLDSSVARLSRIENARTSLRATDVAAMCTLYRATPETSSRLSTLAREAKQKGWWESYKDLLTSSYVELEADALTLRQYEGEVVPGILQTEQYMRAVMRARRPVLSAEEIERRVLLRIERQARLTRSTNLRLWTVLGEAALVSAVGGRDVMLGQLDHLAELTESPQVTLQVLPFSAGARCTVGGFAILTFDGSPPIAYQETVNRAIYPDGDDEVDLYELMFDHLRAQADRPERSVAAINRYRDNFEEEIPLRGQASKSDAL